MREEPTKGLMAYQLAERFYEVYERLASQFDYETREETAVPWAQVPEQNRLFMLSSKLRCFLPTNLCCRESRFQSAKLAPVLPVLPTTGTEAQISPSSLASF